MSQHPAGRVLTEQRGDVLWITLDRQERLNALSPSMIEQLGAAVGAAARSTARTIVITGAGDRAFCAGADVRMLAELPADAVLRTNLVGHEVFDAIERLGKPVIAAIGGHALGGGLELALACDVRIAASGVRMGLPEVGIGVMPGWGGTWRLADAVGAARAREMILTGRLVEAEAAATNGLVHQVVPRTEMDGAVAATAATLAAQSPDALAAAKAALAAARPPSPGQAQVESGNVASLVTGAEFRSRLARFLRKS
jgi:enoyl-CoA hydratase/carnithine racemase